MLQQYIGGAWANNATGTTPNASETVAGKVELSTVAQTDALTTTGETGAALVTQQDYIPATEKTELTNDDLFVIYDSTASNNKKKVKASTIADNANPDFNFGDGSDGDVTITTTVTLSRDMFYNNLTINTGGQLKPNGYKIFVRGTFTNNVTA